ncbi:hypothetical protein BKA62DRAFT_105935 [Auriculariales sp. MPI-PUGE-AT-0066]|nr:hypothetical protein BKA62DRAFT_105935 [Auriculariales sp. MPI-PUGE-AT-0066]
MLTHRGFEAWVECDGEVMTSHSAWCDGRTIGATVVSQEGKTFGIHWRDVDGGVESFGVVQIDGNIIGGRGLNGTPGRAVSKSTAKVSDEIERALVFSKLGTTEHEEELERMALHGDVGAYSESLDSLGTIELRVEHVRYGDFKRPQRFPYRRGADPRDVFAQRVVHETSKKLGCHQTCLGPERYNPPRRPTQPDRPARKRLPFDPYDDRPHVIFKFSYAPRDILIARGLIPQSAADPQPPSQRQHSSSIASSRPPSRARSAPPELDAVQPSANTLFLRGETIDLDAPVHRLPIDLTKGEEEDPPKPLSILSSRHASIVNRLDVVNLLQEQLRQAKDDLQASRAALSGAKPQVTPAIPFSVYDYYKPGEVVDMTDL